MSVGAIGMPAAVVVPGAAGLLTVATDAGPGFGDVLAAALPMAVAVSGPAEPVAPAMPAIDDTDAARNPAETISAMVADGLVDARLPAADDPSAVGPGAAVATVRGPAIAPAGPALSDAVLTASSGRKSAVRRAPVESVPVVLPVPMAPMLASAAPLAAPRIAADGKGTAPRHTAGWAVRDAGSSDAGAVLPHSVAISGNPVVAGVAAVGVAANTGEMPPAANARPGNASRVEQGEPVDAGTDQTSADDLMNTGVADGFGGRIVAPVLVLGVPIGIVSPASSLAMPPAERKLAVQNDLRPATAASAPAVTANSGTSPDKGPGLPTADGAGATVIAARAVIDVATGSLTRAAVGAGDRPVAIPVDATKATTAAAKPALVTLADFVALQMPMRPAAPVAVIADLARGLVVRSDTSAGELRTRDRIVEPAAGFMPGGAPVSAALPAADRIETPAAPRATAPAETATTVTSDRLGPVRIAVEGGLQDLRVSLGLGAAGAALVAADVPRLVADLAGAGVRLQSLDIGGAGVGSSGSGPSGQPRQPQAFTGVAVAALRAPPPREAPQPDRYA